MTKSEIPGLDEVTTTLFDYDQWRGNFLNRVLWIISVLGIFLILPNISSSSSVELVLFFTVYIALLIVTIFPLPYSIKASTVIVAAYFVSIYTLIRFGPWSDGSLFFLATILFAAILFDEKVDRWIFGLNAISLIVVGLLNLTGRLIVTESDLPNPSTTIWLTYIVDYLVMALIILWALTLLKSGFRNVAEQFRKALFFVNKDRTELEERVNERTALLTRKTEQLRSASYITRQTSEVQDLETVLNIVVNLVMEQFSSYHAAIFLMNESGNEVILQAASSEGGKQMLSKGYFFNVDSNSLVGSTAAQKKPRIALDIKSDSASSDNSDLPKTRSEIALPLMIHDRVIGVLDIQSDQPQAYRIDDIDTLQTVADQVAISIENMRLLEEAQTALLQIEMITASRTREAWNRKIQDGRFSYTYTPLGMQTGKSSGKSDHSINIPISLRGQKIGSISLERKGNVAWNQNDIDMVNEVAYQTGLAMDNIRLVDEATERARQEQTVGEIATRFSQSTDIDSLLQTAARELGQVEDIAEVSVYIGQIPDQAPVRRRTKRTSG
jgi:GAF domain-containing protein